MLLICWPPEEGKDAEEIELADLQALWAFIREHPMPTEGDYVREISANDDEHGKPYLVLSWVEVEE